jgi:hypothetical protein
MKNLVLLGLAIFIGWYGYSNYRGRFASVTDAAGAPEQVEAESHFKCDGRIYCSQMTSCREATFFLQNCPGTKMDGNNDGVPCERQWCK